MSIEIEYIREYGEKEQKVYTPTCDICGEPLFNCSGFFVAVKAASMSGWKRKKVDGHYEDYCPDCLELMKEEI